MGSLPLAPLWKAHTYTHTNKIHTESYWFLENPNRASNSFVTLINTSHIWSHNSHLLEFFFCWKNAGLRPENIKEAKRQDQARLGRVHATFNRYTYYSRATVSHNPKPPRTHLPTERTVTSPWRLGRPSLDLLVGFMKCHRLCLQQWHTSCSTGPPTVCRWWPQTCFPGVPPGDRGPGLTGGLPGVLGVTGLRQEEKKEKGS